MFGIYLIIALRSASAFLVLWEPFWGTVVAVLLDLVDAPLMTYFAVGWPNSRYQILDKLQDLLLLLVCFYYLMRYQPVPDAYLTFGAVLFFVRVIGMFVMLSTKQRKVLLITPNFFQYYFLVVAFFVSFGISVQAESGLFILANAVLFVFNYGQEITLHYLELHPWQWVQSLFKRSQSTN